MYDQRLLTRILSVALPIGLLSWVASAASAQADRAPCPGIDAAGEPSEHALCWDARRLGGECTADTEDCLQQTLLWCADAALDDPRVSNACFLALVRSGRLDEARDIAEYLGDPSPQALRCREALTGMLPGRVVSNPAGAEVSVDGRSYGTAPVDVQLSPPWWEHVITVRFQDREVAVEGSLLRATFDPASCRLGDIVVGDDEPRSVPMFETPGEDPFAYPSSTEATDGSGLEAFGWVLISTAAASGLTALITGVAAEMTYQDLSTSCGGSVCGPERLGDIALGSDLAMASTVTLFTGIGLGIAGLILLLTSGTDDPPPEGPAPPSTLQMVLIDGPSPLGAGVRVTF